MTSEALEQEQMDYIEFLELEAAARERNWVAICRFPIYRIGWEADNAGPMDLSGGE